MNMEKQVYGLIRKFSTVRREQIDAFFPGREKAVKQAIKRLSMQGKIYCNPLTKLIAVNETACRQKDDGMLEVLWALAELKNRGLAEDWFPVGKEEYPVRIVVVGKKEMYDILYVGVEEEKLAAGILERIYLPDCKHIVMVRDLGMAGRLPVRQVFAFCTVSGEGKVRFYEGK